MYRLQYAPQLYQYVIHFESEALWMCRVIDSPWYLLLFTSDWLWLVMCILVTWTYLQFEISLNNLEEMKSLHIANNNNKIRICKYTFICTFSFVRSMHISINKIKHMINSTFIYAYLNYRLLAGQTSSAVYTFAGRSEIWFGALVSVLWIILKTSLRSKFERSFSGFLYFRKFTLK